MAGRLLWSLGTLAMAGILIACGAPTSNTLVRTSNALTAGNGTGLNGVKLNGVKLNGVKLNGGELVGVTSKGDVHTQDLVGAAFVGQLDDGNTLAIQLTAARRGEGPDNDFYYLLFAYESDHVKQPLCGVDAAGVPVEAIALAGTWNEEQGVAGGGSWTNDPDHFTIACRGGALTKCVEWGYAPWREEKGDSLAPHHQACSRMVRADYCGNGTPYTVDGTAINFYDEVGIQFDEAEWLLEAEWTAQGASCVTAAGFLRALGAEDFPMCVLPLIRGGCAKSFGEGTLLITEFEPPFSPPVPPHPAK